jgi:cytidylate kinase
MNSGTDLGARRAGARRCLTRVSPAEILLGRTATEYPDEACSVASSRVAAVPGVRAALLDRQRAFREPPGLVADGRDMGSVVFPDARLKVFLTASPETRAERRYKQLKDKGIAANIATLLLDLAERDARDAARAVAPLKPAPDARILDTTGLAPDEAADTVLAWYRESS